MTSIRKIRRRAARRLASDAVPYARAWALFDLHPPRIEPLRPPAARLTDLVASGILKRVWLPHPEMPGGGTIVYSAAVS